MHPEAILVKRFPARDMHTADLASLQGAVVATHSSVPAQRIPWEEGSGGLQSMGSQRVRHD